MSLAYPQRFEHRADQISVSSLANSLKIREEEGWELVSTAPDPTAKELDNLWLFFKRPVAVKC